MEYFLKTTSTTGLHRRSPDIGTTLSYPHSVLDAIRVRTHFRLRQTLESIRGGAGRLDVISGLDSGAVSHAPIPSAYHLTRVVGKRLDPRRAALQYHLHDPSSPGKKSHSDPYAPLAWSTAGALWAALPKYRPLTYRFPWREIEHWENHPAAQGYIRFFAGYLRFPLS